MDAPVFDESLRGLAANVARVIDDASRADAVLHLVRRRAPDERLAMAFLLQLAEISRSIFNQALGDDGLTNDLVFCLGGSELIGSGLVRSGSAWLATFEHARRNGVQQVITSSEAIGESVEALAEYRRKQMLLIAIGDLLGRITVNETVEAMSQLADDCIRGALAIASRDEKTGAAAEKFCILAMGKLGASELNLSSDIDLIYLYEGHDLAELDTARRLGERVTEILGSHCFRIDMRLRPGGSRAALVSSIDGALNFYQSFGQTWERAAMLRARPVAGAIAAGERLLNELSRFVYRVYLDFETIRQLRAMKQQIENELGSVEMVRRNIKLGYGGIRELEFVVQALALIHGGRDARLRTARTVPALERLASCGYMPQDRAWALSEAYIFQRNVEHKLQVAAGLQTHTLPADPRGLAILAARLGYGKAEDAVRRFNRELDARRALVAEQFRQMLGGEAERTPGSVSATARAAWQVAQEPEKLAPLLMELGFARAHESAVHLGLLARTPASSSQNRREMLDRLGPRLLDEIGRSPDPDLAVMNLASFIGAVGARTSFLSLLEEHPATRRILLRLFGSSTYLSTLFIRHPEMIDTLVRSDLAQARRLSAEMAQELSELVEAALDTEARLDAIRAFRHQEFLRIAIADLAGELTLEQVRGELTNLAEIVVREALVQATIEVARRTAIPEQLRLCVLAMGRMGAGETSYNSDLDLIFIYSMPGETAASGREIASRVVQKLIAFIESPTREGYAYKIDLRLRPSGRAGPLVTSLEGFEAYHQQSSALWERQSLVRARVVAGDPVLGEEVEAARKRFVFEPGLDAAGIAEIAAMRERIEAELGQERPGRLNLKQGTGGLIDIEFLTQMMALRYGRKVSALQVRNTSAMIQAIRDAGLMAPDEAATMADDYRFFSELEKRLRIENDQAAAALPTQQDLLAPIAHYMGYTGADAAGALLVEVEDRRRQVRSLFLQRFAVEQDIDET
ncbi:MAG TPA: bifunctional [glutamate--ammonia ligase]-adenylyl-L-tyrosine phosphorylase/[glutamate--ammonia-ligase] adenylyltransferase [Candidatus Binataceae bacterium]|nr:bifunctional [glutamate--ammonia ligase]-adenylyl-L-tyrosine phosphorylase/[glutamate--ammonia-ligase] adenylyltransferase [Candidatus Binataceae bacterium]